MRRDISLANYAGVALCAFAGGWGAWFFISLLGADQSICVPSDSNCFRDWLAATSGWVGALVTVFGLFYLAQQVRALNVPFIQMRLADLIAELASIDQLAIDINISKPGNSYNRIEDLARRLRGKKVNPHEAKQIIDAIENMIAEYSNAFRRVAALNAAAGDEVIAIIRHDAVRSIKNVHDRLADMMESFINHHVSTKPFPIDFVSQEVGFIQEHMSNADRLLQRWHFEISQMIEVKRDEIDAKISG